MGHFIIYLIGGGFILLFGVTAFLGTVIAGIAYFVGIAIGGNNKSNNSHMNVNENNPSQLAQKNDVIEHEKTSKNDTYV